MKKLSISFGTVIALITLPGGHAPPFKKLNQVETPARPGQLARGLTKACGAPCPFVLIRG